MSQCERILALLQQRPHTTAEILRVVPCIVHSRVAELRDKHGVAISHERTGPGASGSVYSLVSTEAGAHDPAPASGATGPSSPEGPGRPGLTPSGRSGSDPEQLELAS